jgi:hypothetical protein
MKKFTVVVVLALMLGQHVVFAQSRSGDSGFTEEGIGIKTGTTSSSSTGAESVATQTMYHLLILDRSSAVDSDISGVAKDALLYKAKHGKTGYLIALYKVTKGSQAAGLPSNSAIVLELVTNRKSTISEFVNSAPMKNFVTEPKVLSRLREALTLDE